MNVGIVTTWFERGAAYVSKQYQQAISQGHNVFIYARGGESYAIGQTNWDHNNVTWGKKPINPVNTAINLKDFRNWIMNNSIEVVIFNEQNWWRPVEMCKDIGVKVGSYIDYYTEETIPLFNLYDFLLCNTKRHYEAFKWHPQCYYIPWGTDIELYKPKLDQRKHINSDSSLVYFHSCGHNPSRKGTSEIIKAFTMLENSNSKIIIHSQVNLNNFYPDLKIEIENLIDKGRLEIIYETVPAPGLYHLGDVYIYPSYLDGIGLTVAEALASGLPVITSNNAPMNEFVIDGMNGKLIDIERFFARSDGYYWPQCKVSQESLLNTIKYFEENKHKIDIYKENSRAFAVKELDWQLNSKKILEILPTIKLRKKEEWLDTIKLIKKYEYKRFPLQKYPKTLIIATFISRTIKKIREKWIK
ncbi:glycosyltransferase family 4 protein [Peribacillus frigoritolerans]|uniref:glycosyltransferase family 4 protein n=1 Tax=Peribacillus frigoritolerans TaxID=450367 RepID=UPI002079C733|nr:glycosyltransferase family 4 protein [Peribacillus frigoritolerans]USK78801.1 glycosyltransferase family 4 protein [Peribacillus frigoritolerans]